MMATHSRLFRQGSMNLPRPEDSGVPATHPDMCILRIRRQHLLEVCFQYPSWIASSSFMSSQATSHFSVNRPI